MNKRWGVRALFLVSAVALSVWSYAFVDPNLVLVQSSAYLRAQSWLASFNIYPWFSTYLYIGLVALLFVSYGLLLVEIKRFPQQKWLSFWLVLALVLLVGHNALSHDIFNYLFNAKMVMLYHVNPHVQTALNFASDPWVRFMHNVDTPAPYGWGWTVLSLLPFSFGFGKFLTAYVAMKAFMLVGLMLVLACLRRMSQRFTPDRSESWLLFAFQPLVLVEVLLNGHNDVWMMAPALASVLVVSGTTKLHWRSRELWVRVALTALLLGLSIWQKYVTVVLIPILLLFLPWSGMFRRMAEWFRPYWADLAIIALVIPLTTARSQQFHPWYLVWALCFLSFAKSRWIRVGLQGLAISALLRYIPWLLASQQYNPDVEFWMRVITWSGLPLAWLWLSVQSWWQRRLR